MAWDPNQYLRFGDERTRPAMDLASRIRVENPRAVIDLGCGPGNSTQVLRRMWPNASVTGLDSSPTMIAKAQQAYPGQQWVLADIQQWRPETPFDIIFSNAALQWIPNHRALIRRLFGHVAAGGALAFQIPSSAFSPVRTLIHEIADDPAWNSRMGKAKAAFTMEEPGVYYDALAENASSLDIWETEYHHVMDAPSAIVTWFSSTGLRPFLEALDTDEERQRFTMMLTEQVTKAYPRQSNGRILFRFRRLFVVAYPAGTP